MIPADLPVGSALTLAALDDAPEAHLTNVDDSVGIDIAEVREESCITGATTHPVTHGSD